MKKLFPVIMIILLLTSMRLDLSIARLSENHNDEVVLLTGGIDIPGLKVEVYPNPVENQVQVRFSLAQKSNVTVILMDGFGRKIKMLLSDELPAGENNFTWQLLSLPAGVYQLVFQTMDEITTKQLVIGRFKLTTH